MTIVDTSSKVRKERISISSAALFDILLIALMFMMLCSKFILAPGFTIDLTGATSLPQLEKLDNVVADDGISVLNAKGNSMIIYDGAIFNTDSFRKKMASRNDGKSRGALLIKADKNVDTQTLVDICSSAKAGGFTKVQIAAEPLKK